MIWIINFIFLFSSGLLQIFFFFLKDFGPLPPPTGNGSLILTPLTSLAVHWCMSPHACSALDRSKYSMYRQLLLSSRPLDKRSALRSARFNCSALIKQPRFPLSSIAIFVKHLGMESVSKWHLTNKSELWAILQPLCSTVYLWWHPWCGHERKKKFGFNFQDLKKI